MSVKDKKQKEPTDLEKKRATKTLTTAQKGKTIHDFLFSDENQARIKQGAPAYLTPESVTRVALTVMQKNTKLLNCSQGSILQCLIDCAAYGLVPSSVTNEAHLIPFKDTCVLVVGYMGLVKMATNTGLVSHVEVNRVFANDHFEIFLGTAKRMDHVPAKTDRGEYIGSYAVVCFTNGHKDFEYMTREQGLAHGKRFSKNFSSKDSPWKLDEESMINKSCVRGSLKYVPKSPVSEKLAMAIAMDEIQVVLPFCAVVRVLVALFFSRSVGSFCFLSLTDIIK